MKSNYLVCYDIANPKRLNRVCRLMKGMGLHIQYSVFLSKLTWHELKELKDMIRLLIKKEEDDVRIYPLPAEIKVTVMGCGDRIPDGVEIFE